MKRPAATRRGSRRPGPARAPVKRSMRPPRVAVVLTAWKRDYFDKQIPAVLGQTLKPTRVFVWQNEAHVDIRHHVRKHGLRHVQAHQDNFKFHGRFTLPLLFDEEFVAIFDDDCIPGRRWLENCVRCVQEHNCIAGANGRVVDTRTWRQRGSGAGQPVPQDLEVDFVGHSWVFRREWLAHLWNHPTPTFNTGEDIHLAAACKLSAGIRCFVPRQPEGQPEWMGDTQNWLGTDAVATYRTDPQHITSRKDLIKHWVGRGWRLLESR